MTNKNIVFCADGTWNDPYEDDNSDKIADPTNVFKLFSSLKGTLSPESKDNPKEQEKSYEEGGTVQQVAKYLHGVGDSDNPIMKFLGGTFGVGVIARIVRGYTFISRNYEPGDSVFIIGFSRGAYTARALSGLISSEGLLRKHLTKNKKIAYERGVEVWYQYRKRNEINPFSEALGHLKELAQELPNGVFVDTLHEQDLLKPDGIEIKAVAVWDTVGAMGFPSFAASGKRIDAYKFANKTLSERVSHGFHAISLDERRDDFTPTLWEPSDKVTQRLFPGAHADVGGGYPMNNDESGLSDGSFEWLKEKLSIISPAVIFSTPNGFAPIKPNAAGVAHEPWSHWPWDMPGVKLGKRQFNSEMNLEIDNSIRLREKEPEVISEPGTKPQKYDPTNIPFFKEPIK